MLFVENYLALLNFFCVVKVLNIVQIATLS